MTGLTSGSLFAGYGGLAMAVEEALGANLAAIDWSTVPRVDVLEGGFPCTDVSAAGARAGLMEGTRSGLWGEFARAIQHLRPSLVVIENVRGLLSAKAGRGDADDPELDPLIAQLLEDGDAETETDPAGGELGPEDEDLGDDEQPGPVLLRALGAVLGDLADLGYDAVWCGLRAADIGAPHARYRIFVLAWPAEDTDGSTRSERWEPAPGQAPPGWARAHPGGRSGAHASDANGTPRRPFEPRCFTPRSAQGTVPEAGGGIGRDSNPRPAPDPTGNGRNEGRTEPEGQFRRPDAPVCGDAAADTERGGRDGGPRTPGWRQRPGTAAGRPSRGSSGGETPADSDGLGLIRSQSGLGSWEDAQGRSEGSAPAPADPDSSGQRTNQPDLRTGQSDVAWGDYAPAIARWESILGRVAPAPTELSPRGSQRLSAHFVEWLMGLPPGWVTDVPGLSRNDQLKALGNGVVWQQGAAAIRYLLQFVPVHVLDDLYLREQAS